MCGIVGIWKSEGYADKLNEYWKRLKHRGTDSYGALICLNNNKIKVLKSLYSDLVLERLKEIEESNKIHWVLAHNRKASVGSVTLELAHPIVDDGKKYVIVHNGTKKAIVDLFTDFDSDTEALNIILHKIKTKELKKQILKNCGVVFAFDFSEKTLTFHKSNRSLYISNELQVLASEPIESGKWKEVKETDYLKIKLTVKNNFMFFDRLPAKKKEVKYSIKEKKCIVCNSVFYAKNGERICPDCNNRSYYRYSHYNYIYNDNHDNLIK